MALEPTRLGSSPDDGGLPGTLLPTADVADHGAPIGKGSLFSPGKNSSPVRPVGTFGFAPAQRSGRGARPDPFDDQVSQWSWEILFFRRVVSALLLPFSSARKDFYSKNYRGVMCLPVGSRIVLLVVSDIAVGVP